MKNQWLMIKQLDKQLKEWQRLARKYARPRKGWVKTIRLALGISAEQFAKRLGLTLGRINQLEKAEIHNAVSLRTLNEAANALDCELIYVIVPKDHSSLEGIIKNRAEEIANERIMRVAHSMSLEAQTVDAKTLKFQRNELIKSLMQNINKKFWKEDSICNLKDPHFINALSNSLNESNAKKQDQQNALHQKLIEILKKNK